MTTSIPRFDDWRARLATEMDRQRLAAFDWGGHDCALGLACGAVRAMTGVDLARGWRGYRTAPGALRTLRRRGYASLGDAVAAVLPEYDAPFAQAQVGDIGVIPSDGEIGEALCVVDGATLIVLTDRGHGRRPREDMTRAFRVG